MANTAASPSEKRKSTNPRPDYIIEFSLVPFFPTAPAPAASKADESDELQREYESLISVLKDAGLEATGRPGAIGTKTLLIFVRASEERVQAEIHRERLSDWLHGVGSTKPSPRTPRDFSAEPIQPSERLRLVYSVITSPREAANASVISSSSSGATAGLSSFPSPKGFPHVKSVFPPHDLVFNEDWLKKWADKSHIFNIPAEELTRVKDHMGETIALYFAFLRYYFFALSFPAGLGLIFYLFGLAYSPLYSLAVVAWSVVFLESWTLKEKELSVSWGTYGVHQVEGMRHDFVGSEKRVDPVSGVEKDCFPWYTTLGRQLATIPVLLLFGGALASLISCIYAIETLVGEVYHGPGKRYLALVPTVLFAGLVPQVTALWEKTARRLTAWENHPHDTEHQHSLTLKVFALNFLVAYGSLLLTSYIYIPFGGFLVPHILSLLPNHSLKPSASTAASFSINSSKLHTQIVAYTLTNQVVGAFTEIGVPAILRLLNREVAKHITHPDEKELKPIEDEESEKEFLERVRFEATLPEYTVFADYAEMVGQFGYLTLFSVIWPIAPVWSFVNNFFELRSDAYKLTHQSRRPVPTREASIGPWLEVLGFATWFAALTNASLVYLYEPHAGKPSYTSEFLANLTQSVPFLPSHNSTISTTNMALASSSSGSSTSLTAIKATLFAALLVALASEHLYLLFRSSVRFVLYKMAWKDSPSENFIRKGAMDLKVNYLDEMGLKDGPKKLAERSGMAEEAREKDKEMDDDDGGVGRFWKREDVGLEEIKRRGKVE